MSLWDRRKRRRAAKQVAMAASLSQVEEAMARDPGVSPVLLVRLASTEPRLWRMVRDNPACPDDLRLWIDVQIAKRAGGVPGGLPEPTGAVEIPDEEPARQRWDGGRIPPVESVAGVTHDLPDAAVPAPAKGEVAPPPATQWDPPAQSTVARSQPTSAEVTNAASTGHRSRRLVVLLGAGVTLAIVAGLALVVLRDDRGGVTAMPGAFAAQPVDSWTLTAEQVLGSRATFDRGDGGAGTYAFDEAVVAEVSQAQGQTARKAVVGIDPLTGEPRWREIVTDPDIGDRSHVSISCATPWTDDVLGCIRTTYEGSTGVSSLEFRDPVSGDVIADGAVDRRIDGLTGTGDSVYTATLHTDGESFDTTLTSGSVADPESDWVTTVPDPRQFPSAYSWDGPGTFQVVGGNLLFASGPLSVLIDRDTGSTVDAKWNQGSVRPLASGYYARSYSDPNRTEVYDADSEEQFSAVGAVWSDWRAQGPRRMLNPSLVGIGRGVYELATGNRVWATDTAKGYVQGAIVGSHAVTSRYSPSREVDTLTVMDSDDGHEVWSDRGSSTRWELSSDGTMVTVVDDTVTALDPDDGRTLWSEPLPSSESATGALAIGFTAGSLVVTRDDRLLGLTDFGGDPASPTVEAGSAMSSPAAPTDEGTPQATASEQTVGTTIAPCPTPPDLDPFAVDSDRTGMIVSFKMAATCSGGQYLDDSAYTITLAHPGGDVVASTDFDFSADPTWVPHPDDAVQDATARAHFPVGTFWELPEDIEDDVTAGSVVVQDSASGVADSVSRPAPEDIGVGGVGEADGSDAGRTGRPADTASLAALRTQARRDRPDALSSMEGVWVPQLSSKKLGTQDDGITYDYDAIWRQHMDLRLRFPTVRLLWSGDWSSFEADDYWVTVAGATFDRDRGARQWCDVNGFPNSQCYAKKILQFGSSEDTTVLRE